ncbi:MAG: efflux RND transporter periplasmic adaptor subunit [Alphaproteobacteria bacterium]|nr:efflux RND transporter periplasmic adaptor subunit [Alphaproteobacteria bacterium]
MIRRILLSVLLAAVTAGAGWWYVAHQPAAGGLVLMGNVDLRQVNLAFNGAERIEAVLVEEGTRLHAGQVLARMETSRLLPQVAQAEAQVAAQQATLARLRNGNRPEEIEQGRASLASARADALNARQQYERQATLLPKAATTQQALDQTRAAADVAQARVDAAQKALDLLVAGARSEDIALAEAQLHGAEAQLALSRRQLVDAELKSPVDGFVRSRLMEAGEMAAPTRPVFALAVLDPKWVRAYIPEARLAEVRIGMRATVRVDGFPDQPLDGWVGFISPIAEFTPKIVQTEELRTSLVYEIRIYTRDPGNILHMGMPATATLSAAPPSSARPKDPA